VGFCHSQPTGRRKEAAEEIGLPAKKNRIRQQGRRQQIHRRLHCDGARQTRHVTRFKVAATLPVFPVKSTVPSTSVQLAALQTSDGNSRSFRWKTLRDCLGVATVNRCLQRCKLATRAFCHRFTCYEISCQSRDCRGSFDGPIDEELTARRGERLHQFLKAADDVESDFCQSIRSAPVPSETSSL